MTHHDKLPESRETGQRALKKDTGKYGETDHLLKITELD